MESVAVRRKPCMLRLRDSCPFRKLRRHTYGPSWSNTAPPIAIPPIATIYSQPLPSGSPSQAAGADVRQDRRAAADGADDCMDLDDDIDPETGERAQA